MTKRVYIAEWGFGIGSLQTSHEMVFECDYSSPTAPSPLCFCLGV